LGTWNNLVICDELITTAAIKWDMSRLSSVDKSILRLAAYQMRFCDDIPKKVIINEAIEIAKRFSGEQAPRFVNGVLDAILRRLKADPGPDTQEDAKSNTV
jgi:N utilization substance protein B